MTTRINNQFPWPDLHRQDVQHYGLRTKHAKVGTAPMLFEVGAVQGGKLDLDSQGVEATTLTIVPHRNRYV